MKDWRAFVRMHFLYAAYESGLLGILLNPASREDLIQNLHIKRPEILDALLDVGLSVNEIKCKNGRFSIRGRRSRAVAGGEGDMLAAIIQAHVTYYSDAYRNAADRMRGAPLGDDLDKIGGLVARFSKIGEPMMTAFVRGMVAGKSPMRILDVGCGSGVFLKSIAQVNQHATGIGIDIDRDVASQAARNMENWGLRDKFRILAGDIRTQQDGIEGPFDLILLYNILYYFLPDERHDLFNRLRSVLSPTGDIMIAMSMRSRGKDLGAANLNMVNCSLKGLTPLPGLKEIKTQLRACGLRPVKGKRLVPGSSFYAITAGIG
jgi:2-polyprenyl-3-methyl-5-hydroxy-6-metoxy-1,4-benzoquinol methylase